MSGASSPRIPRPRAILLNSPHNPTGGVATRDDLAAIAEVVRGTELMVFSDEPYCHMVWSGRHASILAEPGMLEHTVAAYTFSKSYSMSGWRIGFAVAAPAVVDAIGKLINTTASCSPPLAQRAAQAALEHDTADPRRLHGTVPPQGRAALRRPGACRRLPCRAPGRHVLRLPGRARGLQPLARSPRTAWRSICWKGPTTTSASPAWAANVSARPARASCGSVAPSPTSASTRPWNFYPRRSSERDRVRRYLEANPQYVLRQPYRQGVTDEGEGRSIEASGVPQFIGCRPAMTERQLEFRWIGRHLVQFQRQVSWRDAHWPSSRRTRHVRAWRSRGRAQLEDFACRPR